MHPLTQKIALWYHTNHRELPWRNTSDPYLIWVSEVILQQTTISQGTDYYLRFIQKFPSVQALAAASEDEVLRQWQGLGYYSRARNLHAAAQQIVEIGHFPDEYKMLRKLKGVGDYTAAAIASIAYNLPYATVDGNVYRVLARYFGLKTPIDSTKGKTQFAELARSILDLKNPGRHNQAMMDLGATVCTPQSPLCMEQCPLADSCIAQAQGTWMDFPVKERKAKVQNVKISYVLLYTTDSLFLHQRPSKGIWAKLWELPLYDEEWQSYKKTEIGKFEHILSHRKIHCKAVAVQIPDNTSIENYKKVKWEELDQYALPRLIEKIIITWKRKTSK